MIVPGPRRLVLRLGGAAAGAVVGVVLTVLFALTGMASPDLPDASAAGQVVCGTSAAGRDAIPARLLPLYARAAERYQLGGQGPFVLAAINRIETGFGANLNVSSAG